MSWLGSWPGPCAPGCRVTLTNTLPGRYGDMRATIGAAIRDMWYNLGELQCGQQGGGLVRLCRLASTSTVPRVGAGSRMTPVGCGSPQARAGCMSLQVCEAVGPESPEGVLVAGCASPWDVRAHGMCEPVRCASPWDVHICRHAGLQGVPACVCCAQP